jgi:hypothetical protein
MGESSKEHTIQLAHDWDTHGFVFHEPLGEEVEVTVSGEADVAFAIFAAGWLPVLLQDDYYGAHESGTFDVELDAPYFLVVFQADDTQTEAHVSSSAEMKSLEDPDGDVPVEFGQTVVGALDYPADTDTYQMVLKKGDVVTAKVVSLMIDPTIMVDLASTVLDIELLPTDDDSGGGVFGYDALLTFEAPEAGTYDLIVQDASLVSVGGYHLVIDWPTEDDPTPQRFPPTPAPVDSESGPILQYTTSTSPSFVLPYPADWSRKHVSGFFEFACTLADACMTSPSGTVLLAIVTEDLALVGLDDMSFEEYVELSTTYMQSLQSDLEVVSQSSMTNDAGVEVAFLDCHLLNGLLHARRLIALEGGIGFNATFMHIDRFAGGEPSDDEAADLLFVDEFIDIAANGLRVEE